MTGRKSGLLETLRSYQHLIQRGKRNGFCVGDIAEVVPSRGGGSETGDIGSEEWVENGLFVGPDGERNVIVFGRVEVELAHILIHVVFFGALRKYLPVG